MTSCQVLITVIDACKIPRDAFRVCDSREDVTNKYTPGFIPYTIASIIYYRTVIILISTLHIVGI